MKVGLVSWAVAAAIAGVAAAAAMRRDFSTALALAAGAYCVLAVSNPLLLPVGRSVRTRDAVRSPWAIRPLAAGAAAAFVAGAAAPLRWPGHAWTVAAAAMLLVLALWAGVWQFWPTLRPPRLRARRIWPVPALLAGIAVGSASGIGLVFAAGGNPASDLARETIAFLTALGAGVGLMTWGIVAGGHRHGRRSAEARRARASARHRAEADRREG